MKGPAGFRWLLDTLLPANEREAVVGDLEELFRELGARRGWLIAAWWYRVEAMRVLGRFAWEAVVEGWTDVRTGRGEGMMESVLRDLEIAVRGLRKRWAISLWSIVALGVGIGLTTTTFSIVWGSLLRGLPVEAPERLVHFERISIGETGNLAVTHHDYLDWRERQSSFQALGAYVEAVVVLEGSDGVPLRLEGLSSNRATFDVLRVEPEVGRLFSGEELRGGGPDVALLSDVAWRTYFEAAPGLVGRSVILNGRPTTIIGIMPRGFQFPFAEDVWLPLRLDRGALERGQGRLDVIGRLQDGLSFEVAAAEFAAIGAALEAEFPETNDKIRPSLKSFNEEFIGEEFPRIAYGLMAGAVLVLIIACANVASLTLLQASRRSRELAVRASLGAGRARLFRQLLTESFVLAALAGVLGAVLAVQGVAVFAAAVAQNGTLRLPHGSIAPYWWDFGVDAAPLAFTILVAVVVTGLVGLVPGVLATRADLNSVLKSGSRNGGLTVRKWSAPLVALETALSGGVLVAAAVMVSSFSNLMDIDDGIESTGLVAGRIGLPTSAASAQAYPDNAARAAFWQQLSDELERTPGVGTATLTLSVPVLRAPNSLLSDEGTPPDSELLPRVRTNMVHPGFFDMFGLQATEGRLLDSQDRAGSERTAVINESLARRHFGEASALGQRIRLGEADSADPWMTVVGVVPDFWLDGDQNRDPEGVYTPLSQSATADPVARHGRLGLRYVWAIVQVSGGARGGREAIQAALARVDPAVPVYDVQTVDEMVTTRLRRYRMFGTFYLVFGAVALFLAVMGTYAVTAFSVASRTPEIGIRMALGAQAGRIRGLVVRQSFQAVLVGLVSAFVLALWITGGLGRVVYGVDPRTPLAFIGGLGVLGIAALVACILPATRATRIDPNVAIRPE